MDIIKNISMKKGLPFFIAEKGKNFSKLFFLLICILLTIKLSGQNIQNMLSETWTNGDWQKSFQKLFTYDGSGYLISDLSQTWDVPSTSWENSAQTIYDNNADGKPGVVTSQIWDGGSWNYLTRSTYTYNTAKEVLTEVTEMWLGVIWQNTSKETNTYDGSGYLTNNLSQSWDFISSAWKNNIQINYTNNPDGNPNQEITQSWDGAAWINSTRSTYTYNASNKVITQVTDNWISGNWQPDSRETNTYDGNGYVINNLSQIWDEGSSSWKNETQENFTNNVDGTPSIIISQEWDGTNAWNNAARYTLTYSPSTLIKELPATKMVTIYPNPTSGLLTIMSVEGFSDNASLELYDFNGKAILQRNLDNMTDQRIDISQFAKGIYYLRIKNNKINYCQKVILQ
jgi:hypothetical protein